MKPFKSEITIDDSNFELFLQLIGAKRPATPIVEAAAEPPITEPPTTEPPVTEQEDSRAYTMTEVRAAATELAKAGKQPLLRELLLKNGAGNLSALAESNYAAFMKDLEASQCAS